MKQTFNKYYPYKVWLVAVALVPILMLVRLAFMHNDYKDISTNIHLSIVTFIVGIMLSLPAFVIYYLSFEKFKKLKLNPFILKVILCLIALVGIIITFHIIADADTFLSFDASKLYIIFALSIFIPGFLFSIHKPNNSTSLS